MKGKGDENARSARRRTPRVCRRHGEIWRWSRGVLAAALALAAACGGDGIGPQDLAGTYALRGMNNQPLPYDHEGLGCCTYLNGELMLDADSYLMAITAQNRINGLVFTIREWGAYSWTKPSLTFARDTFEIAPFLLDVATVSGDSIHVALGGEGPGSPDQVRSLFVRVR